MLSLLPALPHSPAPFWDQKWLKAAGEAEKAEQEGESEIKWTSYMNMSFKGLQPHRLDWGGDTEDF